MTSPMDDVVCTAHIGYVERDQLEMYYSDQFDMVLAYARGNPANVINPEALAASRTNAPTGC
jgi:D-3-phosphoglycerate dehydrogenase / 2-oxoglutarate reductase